jgi:dolichol-phosphate mannosyltransferase
MAPKKQKSSLAIELSIVIPVYFNAESLKELYSRLAMTMKKSGSKSWEVIFVDDASLDASRQILAELQRHSPHVGIIHLLKNSGSPRAIMAGIEMARGRAVAVIAADLQDPPEMLEEMITRWRKGAQLVMARRGSRGDDWTTTLLAKSYYWIFRKLVSKQMPDGGFDVFLADRAVTESLQQYSDKNSNLFANLIWLGFPFEQIVYRKQSRPFGKSRWTFAKKITYFYDSILSFTYVPLRALTLAGIMSVLFSLAYAGVIVVARIKYGQSAPGYASIMTTLLFFSGMILMGLGLLGEYVWRIFDVIRRQPAFVVQSRFAPKIHGKSKNEL